MGKVIVLQPVMAHYRRSLFTALSDSEDHDFYFIAGDSYKNIKSFSQANTFLLPYLKFSLGPHVFYFLKRSLRLIVKEKPDIIISSGLDPHLIHTILIFLLQKIVLRKKFFWWSHATHGNQGRIGTRLRMAFYRYADGVLSYGSHGKSMLIKEGLKPDNVQVLGNSINTEDYGFLNNVISDKVSGENCLSIIFSGRINPSRRLDILFEAVAQIIKDTDIAIHCIIIGGGVEQELKDQIKKLQIQDVVSLPGAKYGPDAGTYFLNADVMVYPKAIGLSIVQAYSYGIPVITTDKLKIQMPEIELLVPGETGDFYQDENVNDLADKILNWHHILNESRSAVQKKCIDRIHELKYFPDQMAEQLLEFISR